MRMTEAELFEQFGRTTAENAMLRREIDRLRAELKLLKEPQVTGAEPMKEWVS